ncbi:MAG: ATP-binding protein [Bacteroidales bacterium]
MLRILPIYKFITYIVLLVFGTGSTVFLVISSNNIYLIISVSAMLFAIYKLISINNDSMRKVSFMFNAIDCDDYAFKFSDNIIDINDNMLNASLNRIKDILSNAKIKAVAREKYYELIMSSVKTGIVTISDNGNVYQVNKELMRLLRLQVFTHINQLRSLDPQLISVFKEIKAGEKKQHTLKHETGEDKLSLEAAEIIYDGKKLKIISINDIKNALDENEAESWIKLTRVLTHEIMNSLAPITSLSDTLIDINENGSPSITSGLETIRSTSKSLIAFVEAYRKFTHIQTPVKTPFEIKPLLDRVISLLCPDGFPLVELYVTPLDTMIYADENLINQVLVNIIKNAVQAVTARTEAESEDAGFIGKIIIDVSIEPDESILLNVSNNGGAIPANTLKDIFTPFFTTKDCGSGIGLSVSRQIMYLHGGSIYLALNTNKKVTFSIVFN